MRRSIAMLGVALALAVLSAGCGGDDSGGETDAVEPASWASGFCEALERFTAGISESGSGLEGDGLPSGDAIVEAVDNAADAAGAFADDLGELGRRGTSQGARAECAR